MRLEALRNPSPSCDAKKSRKLVCGVRVGAPMSKARRGRYTYSSATEADSRRWNGGGKAVGQLESIWYVIDARGAERANGWENRSCGRRHRNAVGCAGKQEEESRGTCRQGREQTARLLAVVYGEYLRQRQEQSESFQITADR
jgi:hypothetical protein